MKSRTYKLILCALFAALTAIGAFIKIPFPLVPITLQVMFTTLAGLLIGPKLGSISVAVYVFLGLIGIPVFTGGGGPSYVLQTSFGYLIGFIVGAFITGLIASKGEPSFKRNLIASFTGLLVIYIIGCAYCFLISRLYLKNDVGIWAVVLHGAIMCLPGDIIKCILASFIGKRLAPMVRRKLNHGKA